MSNIKDLIEKLENLSIDEERKKLMKEVLVKLSNDDGMMTLTGKSIQPSIKAGERMFFKATLIGYDKEAIRKKFIRFEPGVLEESSFAGRQLLAFHNHEKIPIGKIVEDWMDNGEKRIIAWTDDEETQLAIQTEKIMELSAGFLPDIELMEDKEDKEWYLNITKVDPAEASTVVFPAYAKAKIESYWMEEEKDEEQMTEEKEVLEEVPKEKLEEVVPKEDKDELNKLSQEKEQLKDQVHILEREKILSRYNLTEKDKELALELDKKYNLSTVDFEAIVEKQEQEEPDEKKGDKLPVSQREEIKSDKEKGIDQAKKLADEYLKKKGYN